MYVHMYNVCHNVYFIYMYMYHIGLGPQLYRDEHTHAHVQELSHSG